jgi:multidrug transporter EmrE-like cation transporter
MDLWHIAAALASAILHAGWNAAIKADTSPRDAMTAQLVATVPIAGFGLLWTGLPAPASWVWIGASTLCNLLALAALLRAYERHGFGLAYPVSRAVSVLLVTLLAALLWNETISLAGMAGIALIALALLLLAIGSNTEVGAGRGGFGWIAGAGLATAAYVLCDAHGVRQAGSSLAYGFAISFINGVAICMLRGFGASPWRALADRSGAAARNALAAIASYLLIVWVWTSAPVAPATALRDTSAVFALALAALWLKEPLTPARLAAILLAAAAMPLLRFA